MRRRGIGNDPMVYLLMGIAGLYWLLGEALDALFLTLAVGVLFLITAFQERRAARALRALKKLSQPHVRIVRNARIQTIDSSQLKVGDHLILQEGGVLPGNSGAAP